MEQVQQEQVREQAVGLVKEPARVQAEGRDRVAAEAEWAAEGLVSAGNAFVLNAEQELPTNGVFPARNKNAHSAEQQWYEHE